MSAPRPLGTGVPPTTLFSGRRLAPAEHQPQAPGAEPTLTARAVLPDCRLHICLYYREILVKELTTSSPEGCRISHGHTYDASSLDQVLFPYPEDNSQRKNIEKLLGHLERGVVLWMAPDGLYAKRLCQSRIFWDGPLAIPSDRPNKLERDQTCKLFDTQQFLSGEVGEAWPGRGACASWAWGRGAGDGWHGSRPLGRAPFSAALRPPGPTPE